MLLLRSPGRQRWHRSRVHQWHPQHHLCQARLLRLQHSLPRLHRRHHLQQILLRLPQVYHHQQPLLDRISLSSLHRIIFRQDLALHRAATASSMYRWSSSGSLEVVSFEEKTAPRGVPRARCFGCSTEIICERPVLTKVQPVSANRFDSLRVATNYDPTVAYMPPPRPNPPSRPRYSRSPPRKAGRPPANLSSSRSRLSGREACFLCVLGTISSGKPKY